MAPTPASLPGEPHGQRSLAGHSPRGHRVSDMTAATAHRHQFSSIQSLSRVRPSATPWTAARQASLSIISSRRLLKLMTIESVMPSNHLSLCRPLLLLPSIFPNIRVFSKESVFCIRWPKYWNFSISSSNEYPGLISFRMDWLDLPAVQGILKSLLQPPFKSINSSALSFLYSPTLTSIHDHWKNHSLDSTDLCWQSNDVSAFYYAV